MIILLDVGPEWPEKPERHAGELLQDAGWTLLSVAAALIVLPAIAVDEALRALFPRRIRHEIGDEY